MSMVSLGGSDWLGLGATFGAMTQGTAMCGAKPISGSTEAYDTCVARSLEIQAQGGADAARAAEGQRKTKLIIVALVSVTVLILGIVIIRSRRKS